MFKRVYNYQDVPILVKARAREYVKTFVNDTVPYLEVFLPSSIAIISYHWPIVLSYLEAEMPDESILKDEKKMYEVIAQLIRIHLLDSYLIKQQYEPKETEFELIEKEKSYPKFPFGFYLIDSIIPQETCETYNSLFSYLYLEEKTNDQKYSLTDKDEEWGDLAPGFLRCFYYYLYESIIEEDLSYKINTQALYSANKEVKFSFYPSDSSYSDVITIVFFSDCKLQAQEVSVWRKKEPESFSTFIEKGTIITLKKESLYEWKYTVSDNKGLLIIK
jgi:hypothetical protein